MARIIHTLCFYCTLFCLLLLSQNVELTGVKVQKLTGPVELGEGPHWDDENQKLYYVDINGQNVMSYDPNNTRVYFAHLECGHVGVVVPVNGTTDKFIVGCGTRIVLMTWCGKKNKTITDLKTLATLDGTQIRVNDGKCDPSGRFLIGTMALKVNGVVEENKGSLYSLDSKSKLRKLYGPVTISNGLAWNEKMDTFYYIDSSTYQIWAFDYDVDMGSIRNKRVIFDTKANKLNGIPDGMTTDTNGNLWVAMMFGGTVIQVCPQTGKLRRIVEIPGVDRVSSVAFGGPSLDVLYVTTARDEMTAEDVKLKPGSGCLYSVRGLGVRGHPSVRFNFGTVEKPGWLVVWFIALIFM